MSDPVSNAEIEDVLSSIRRLVSVDKRGDTSVAKQATRHATSEPDAVTAEAATPTEDAGRTVGEARLVLTPSFRVTPDEEEAVTDASESLVDNLALEEWQVPTEAESEAVQTAEVNVDPGVETAQDDQPVPQGPDTLAATAMPDDGDQAAEVEPDVFANETAADELTSEDVAQGDDDEQLKEWLTAEGAVNEGVNDTQQSDDISAIEEEADFDVATFAEDSDEPFDYADAPADEEDDPAKPDAQPITSELEARIAEVEAAVAAREDQWEPDGASEDDYAGGMTEPLPWEDHAEQGAPMFVSRMAQHHGARETEVERDSASVEDVDASAPVVDTPADADFAGEKTSEGADSDDTWYRDDSDTVIDEDALRDLVSEIVRQELQGTLGERITRNVRKLVRREIHRAMMGQELD